MGTLRSAEVSAPALTAEESRPLRSKRFVCLADKKISYLVFF
jgi:hypothetical protein